MTHKKTYYAKLFRRFVFLTMICSLVPLLLVGWGKKDDAEKKDMQNKIHKVIESPRSAFNIFPKNRRKK
ncbi:MAG: hypothetical protein DRH90_23040 [Deltaproteobacteria bacterium]|nr:MAG: hypothetical protein DRH90_23040 [Deltaproteobacteria bacterium]RLC09794.1 MAG: hypothetical protein DRI24_21250 [Deltaproteobacteria bacterium]